MICRKEAKESGYWLRLINPIGESLDTDRNFLLDESRQLMNIFGAMLRNTQEGSRPAGARGKSEIRKSKSEN